MGEGDQGLLLGEELARHRDLDSHLGRQKVAERVGALLTGRLSLLPRATVEGEDPFDRVVDLLQVVAVDDDLGRGVGRQHELVDGDVGEGEPVDQEEALALIPSTRSISRWSS